MIDLGFGLLDRRTVIAVIFTMVLAQMLLGGVIPVDISNAAKILFDIIILTGYIYLARSIYRLPVSLWCGFLFSFSEAFSFTNWHREKITELHSSSVPLVIRWIQIISIVVFMALVLILGWVIMFPAVILNLKYGTTIWGLGQDKRETIFGFNRYYLTTGFFKILDRVGLIIISVLATMPWFKDTYTMIGISGLIFMLLVYVLSGAFGALVEDMISKQENEKKSSDKAIEVSNFKHRPLYVELVNKDDASPLPVKIKNQFPIPVQTQR